MTDRDALAAGHRALLTTGAGNVGIARYLASARVTWQRRDQLGHHAEIMWAPAPDQVEHLLLTTDGRDTAVHRV